MVWEWILAVIIWTMVCAAVGYYVLTQSRRAMSDRYAKTIEENRQALEDSSASLKNTELELESVRREWERARTTKSEFLANISHEIRTPLNGIIGMTEILLDSELTLEQREYAEMVSDSAGALMGIMNEVLDFSKVEAGALTLDRIPFDLKVTVEEVAKMQAFKAQEKGVELIVRYDPDAPRRFLGDPVRIRQVLTHLTSNAIKFTQKGFVLLNIDCQNADTPQVQLKISVEDSGIGIVEEKLSDVFSEFTQADASSTREYGGMGLGLAICKRMVQMMGGEIQVKSSLNEGSIFWFVLTLEADPHAPMLSLERGDLDGVRVLIVDDNEVNRRLYHEQLEHWEIYNRVCNGPGEAIEELKAAQNSGNPYHVLILDYELGDTTGLEVARAIKSNAEIKDVEIVLISSWARKLNAQQLLPNGISGYLMKPVDEAILLETIQAVCGVREKGQATTLITRHSLAEAKAASQTDLTKKKGTSASVLVVEDNLANQKLARAMLEKIGCRVEIANHGRHALTMLSDRCYDLILMDCQMPEMDGYETTLRIRQREGDSKHTPIVAMTANAMQGDRQKCLDAGMDDYISKPIKKEIFFETLAKYLDRRMAVNAIKPTKVLRWTMMIISSNQPSGRSGAISRPWISNRP